MKRFEPLLLLPLLLLHGLLYNRIGEISASRGTDFGPLLEVPMDAAVAFVPVFVIPYMFAWVFPPLLIGYLMFVTKTEPPSFRSVFLSLSVLMLACYTLWIAFPVRVGLRIDEPFLAAGGWLEQLVMFNYQQSSHWNACPSFHVAGPWFFYRIARELSPRLPRVYLGIVLAIIISTVFIRIHYLADILGGILISELVIRMVFQRLRKRHMLERISWKVTYAYSITLVAVGFAWYAYLARP